MLSEEDLNKLELLGPSRFTFNGNIISEIGEESISNPFVAIAELIKNSYDADGKQINLNFVNLGKINPRIIISDDGIGMDSSQIKDNWLDIGSPHKKEIKRTKEHQRILVGAKGIGRFASHCLGKNMELITASRNEHFGYNLALDWGSFSKENKATDVDIKTGRFKKNISTKGTTIIIENLKQKWSDDERLKSLLKDIYLLTNPIDPPKNFKISPNIAKDYKNLKKLNKAFLEKAAYHLRVKLTKDKNINFYFYKNGELIKSDKKTIRESISCGDVTFDFYFYYKQTAKWKEWLGKDISKKESSEISSMLEEYGGIKLYRDKFRVKPYGDKNSDWIGLDKWSRDNSIVPGNTQSFGVVSISKETNPLIEDVTTREGVNNNSAYFDLVKFVTTSIKLFTDLRSGEEPGKAKGKKSKKKKRVSKSLKVETPKMEERPAAVADPPFIDVIGGYPDTFYLKLKEEINNCYDKNYPNATFLLSRKLIECLIYSILEKKFPTKKELWWNPLTGYPLNLSPLITNLYQNRRRFQPNIKRYIEKINFLAEKFRDEVNKTTHNIYDYLDSRDELEQFKINEIAQLLVKIYNLV